MAKADKIAKWPGKLGSACTYIVSESGPMLAVAHPFQERNMKFARYLAHGQISYGVAQDGMVKELTTTPFEDYQVTDHTHPISDVKLLAPCVPGKILAIGLNYSSHLHDRPGPTEPMVFYKLSLIHI